MSLGLLELVVSCTTSTADERLNCPFLYTLVKTVITCQNIVYPSKLLGRKKGSLKYVFVTGPGYFPK